MSSARGSFSCIAVDMGAGSIRIMLAYLGMEGISLEEVHRFENQIRVQQGRDTWDLEQISSEIRLGVSKAIANAALAPCSIGVDSWGADYVLLNRSGDLVETPLAYRDKRTAGMWEEWREMMSDEETFRRTGINFYLFNTLFQLLSARGSKALERTSKILFIPCYINYLLSGRAVNELTIASTSQMLGVDGEGWDPEILERLGLDEARLSGLVQPGTRLGRVILPEAGDLHLENVAVCGHDTACVVAALPAEDPDFAFISAGTWCIVGVESVHPLLSEKALQLGITNERAYGNRFRPLKNITGLWLMQGLKKQLSAGISFEQMEEMLEEDAEVTQVIDPDHPLFYNPENMKVAFDTFFEQTGQAIPGRFSDYLHCAYDSLCFSFRFYIEQLEELCGRSIGVIHLVGGGSQSTYLCQRTATLCGRKVVAGPVEGAAMGNVLVQALAMGWIGGLQEGRKLVRESCRVRTYRPGHAGSGLEARYKTYLTFKT